MHEANGGITDVEHRERALIDQVHCAVDHTAKAAKAQDDLMALGDRLLAKEKQITELEAEKRSLAKTDAGLVTPPAEANGLEQELAAWTQQAGQPGMSVILEKVRVVLAEGEDDAEAPLLEEGID